MKSRPAASASATTRRWRSSIWARNASHRAIALMSELDVQVDLHARVFGLVFGLDPLVDRLVVVPVAHAVAVEVVAEVAAEVGPVDDRQAAILERGDRVLALLGGVGLLLQDLVVPLVFHRRSHLEVAVGSPRRRR